MPPTHFEGGKVNMFQPYVLGQSGTERPESVLVTRLPASSSSTVQAATNLAKRWSMDLMNGQEGLERLEGQGAERVLRSLQPIPPVPPGPALIRGDGGRLEREVR